LSALQDAADVRGDEPRLVEPLLTVLTSPMRSMILQPGRRPPAAGAALSAWCAAALSAGALPALRRLMAMAPFRVHAASVACVLALFAAEPAAAAGVSAGGGGDGRAPEGADGAPPEPRPDEAPLWRDDPTVATAIEILLASVTGAKIGRRDALLGPRCCGRSSADAPRPS
jgi:hypothetical protein